MTTGRLFHEDPALTRFDARIVETGERGGRPLVVLDRTAFYPTSGGQPHDTGLLDGVRVVEVVEETAWGRILHFLEAPLAPRGPDERVAGAVDWHRRFDHMQQHTGQHLLSRAFTLRKDARTLSFHLGEREVTVDLDTPSLSLPEAEEVEDLLAQVIREDRPISPRWAAPSEVPAGIEVPEEGARTGRVRLVEVEGFDLDPCCGTHCSRTAEVGAVTILGWEKAGHGTRVSFLCGERARLEARERIRWTGELARTLSTDTRDLPGGLSRIIEEARELRRQRKELLARLAAGEAAAIEAVVGDKWDLVALEMGERSSEEVLPLAAALRQRPRTLVLLAWKEGEGGRVLAARSAGLELDVRPAIASASELLGGRGGGRPESAQGGGPRFELLPAALACLRKTLG